MKHYAGIDVSLNSSSVCVIDEHGKIASDGESLLGVIFDRDATSSICGYVGCCSESGAKIGITKLAFVQLASIGLWLRANESTFQ